MRTGIYCTKSNSSGTYAKKKTHENKMYAGGRWKAVTKKKTPWLIYEVQQ